MKAEYGRCNFCHIGGPLEIMVIAGKPWRICPRCAELERSAQRAILAFGYDQARFDMVDLDCDTMWGRRTQ